MHFTGERTKGPGLMQGSAASSVAPVPSRSMPLCPRGTQTAPLCEDTQVPALLGGIWVTLDLVIREANIDLHIGFLFIFHTSGLALTSSLLLST